MKPTTVKLPAQLPAGYVPFRDCLGPWRRPRQGFEGCQCLLHLSSRMIELEVPVLLWTHYALHEDTGMVCPWPSEDSGQILFVPERLYDTLVGWFQSSIYPPNISRGTPAGMEE